MNISAEYSLEKKENRRVEPCGHLSITDFIHGDIYRRNMSLDAIHLISLAQPQYVFEPFTREMLLLGQYRNKTDGVGFENVSTKDSYDCCIKSSHPSCYKCIILQIL